MMKLSKETLEIITNFSTINKGLIFREGNELKTVLPSMGVIAKAVVTENFEKTFGIYDLTSLIAVLSAYDEPKLIFKDKYLVIGDGKNTSTTYYYTDPKMIVHTEKEIKMPSKEIELNLTKDMLTRILKLADIVQSPMIAVESDGKLIWISTLDPKNNASHVNKIVYGDGGNGIPYRILFRRENLKMIIDDYTFTISSKRISHLVSKNRKLEYYVMGEADSKYGKDE